MNCLAPLLSAAHFLIVVAAFGGATGSLIGPNLVKASMDAGIPTLAIWIKPFALEGSRRDLCEWLLNQGVASKTPHIIFENDFDYYAERLGTEFSFKQAFDLGNTFIAENIILKNINNAACSDSAHPV